MDGTVKKLYISVIVLGVALIGVTISFVLINTQKSNMIRSFEQDIELANEQIQLANEQIQSANSKISTNLETISSLNEDLSLKEEGLTTAQDDLKKAVEVKNNYIDQYNIELKEKEHYKELFDATSCPTSVQMNYTSNSTMSNSLKSYVEDEWGSVNNSEWEVVWNNSKTAYHKITGEFLFPFIVFFDDDDLGNTNAVFDFTGQCWLDYD